MPSDNFEIHGFHLVTPNWTEQKNYLRILKIQILGQYPAMILLHKQALPQYFSFSFLKASQCLACGRHEIKVVKQ